MFKLATVPLINKIIFPPIKDEDKKPVYLLGQGWYAKGFMDNIDTKKHKITNIYDKTFTNTGQCIRHPEKKIPFDYDIDFINKTIMDIDVQNQTIFAQDLSIDFSENIVVCGVGDHVPVKKWETAIDTSGQTFSIVGAGLVGTEIAFKLADENKNITMYDGLPVTHEFLPPSLKKYVMNEMNKKNIVLHVNRFYNKEPCDKVIFATGSRPNMLTQKWIQTQNLQLEYENKLYCNMYFGGNCVWNTQIDNVGAPTAQLAYDQGKHVATCLNNNELKPYKPKNFIYTMYVGDGYNALYMNNCNYYLIVPSCFIDLYHKYKYGGV